VSNEAKTEYLNSIREEYRKASRREKSVILRHAMLVTGLSKSRLIRRLSPDAQAKPPGRPGRRPRYAGNRELLEHLKRLWLALEQPCGKRLVVILPRVLPKYRAHAPDGLTDATERELLALSPATIDRLLKPLRADRGLCLTKAPTSQWYRSAVPVRPRDWNVTEPGQAQADTVSHCGEDASGAFASTLTVVDIDLHWTELRATYTKRHTGIIAALRDIERSLPFTLRSLHFDSGSEFMNFGVVSFCRGTGPSYGRNAPIEVTRSRPYRKNDNCYVEQKNLTHVRQFVGYERIDDERATEMLNSIYRELWCPYLNFFVPTFKLLRKERIGSRIKKTYEVPRTPYERLLASPAVSDAVKAKLRAQYERLDPFALKAEIERRLKLLWARVREARQEREVDSKGTASMLENPDELLKNSA
jgi:hypothetical protein